MLRCGQILCAVSSKNRIPQPGECPNSGSQTEDLKTPLAEVFAKTIVLFHDESTFQANNYERTQWGTKDDHMLVPKSKGCGIMVSDFILEEHGYLYLNDGEFAAGSEKYPHLKQFARMCIEYGENRYWTSERFLEQLKDSVQITKCKYPLEQGVQSHLDL